MGDVLRTEGCGDSSSKPVSSRDWSGGNADNAAVGATGAGSGGSDTISTRASASPANDSLGESSAMGSRLIGSNIGNASAARSAALDDAAAPGAFTAAAANR